MILTLSITQAELDRLLNAKLPPAAQALLESVTLEQAPAVRVKLKDPAAEILARVEVKTG